jgi:hypothetical protein
MTATETRSPVAPGEPAPDFVLPSGHGEGTDLKMKLLIDRDGIVRNAYIECAREGMAGFGDMPAEEETLARARALNLSAGGAWTSGK